LDSTRCGEKIQVKAYEGKIVIASLLGVSVWIFVVLPLIYLPGPLDRVLPYAPLMTPIVGSIAAIIAIAAIAAQKSIARKRAAIDFFLKTDLDHNMLEAHAGFQSAMKKLKCAISMSTS
jgi:hypothetical protein